MCEDYYEEHDYDCMYYETDEYERECMIKEHIKEDRKLMFYILHLDKERGKI